MDINKIGAYLKDIQNVSGMILSIVAFTITTLIIIVLFSLITNDAKNTSIITLSTALTTFLTFIIALSNLSVAYLGFKLYKSYTIQNTFNELKELIILTNKLLRFKNEFYEQLRFILLTLTFEDHNDSELKEKILANKHNAREKLKEIQNESWDVHKKIIEIIELLESLNIKDDHSSTHRAKKNIYDLAYTIFIDNKTIQNLLEKKYMQGGVQFTVMNHEFKETDLLTQYDNISYNKDYKRTSVIILKETEEAQYNLITRLYDSIKKSKNNHEPSHFTDFVSSNGGVFLSKLGEDTKKVFSNYISLINQ